MCGERKGNEKLEESCEQEKGVNNSVIIDKVEWMKMTASNMG